MRYHERSRRFIKYRIWKNDLLERYSCSVSASVVDGKDAGIGTVFGEADKEVERNGVCNRDVFRQADRVDDGNGVGNGIVSGQAKVSGIGL